MVTTDSTEENLQPRLPFAFAFFLQKPEVELREDRYFACLTFPWKDLEMFLPSQYDLLSPEVCFPDYVVIAHSVKTGCLDR